MIAQVILKIKDESGQTLRDLTATSEGYDQVLRQAIVAVQQEEAAERQRAAALGVSLAQLRQVEIALGQQIDSESAVADAARQHAAAAKAAADALKAEIAQAEKMSELGDAFAAIAAKAEAAEKKLEDIGAAGNDTEQLAIRTRRLKEEIDALEKVTGNAAAAEKARAAVDANAAKALEELKNAQEESANATNNGTQANWQATQGAQSLRKNIGDIFDSLMAGQSPLQVFAQQGEDLANALMMGGDAAEVARRAFGGMVAPILANLHILGPLAVAVAGLALLYRASSLEADRVNEQRRIEKEVAESLVPAENALRDARLDEKEATGKLKELEADVLRIRYRAQDQVAEFTAKQQERIKGIEDEMEAQKKWLTLQRGVAAAMAIAFDLTVGSMRTGQRIMAGESLQQILASDANAINDAIDSVTGLEAAHDAAGGQIAKYNQAIQDNAELVKKAREAEEAGTTATYNSTKAAKEALEIERERQKLRGIAAGSDATRQENARYAGVVSDIKESGKKAKDPALEAAALEAAAQEHQRNMEKIAQDARALEASLGVEIVDAQQKSAFDKASAAAQAYQAVMENLIPPTALTRTQQIISAQIQLAAEFKAGRISAEQYQAGMDASTVAAKKAAEDGLRQTFGIVSQEQTVYEKLAEAKKKALEDYLDAARAAGFTEQKIAADTAAVEKKYLQQVGQATLDQVATGMGAATSLGELAKLDPSGIASGVLSAMQAVGGLSKGASAIQSSQDAVDAAKADLKSAQASGDADKIKEATANLAQATDALKNTIQAFNATNSLGQVKNLVDDVASGLPALGTAISGMVGGLLADSVPALLDGLSEMLLTLPQDLIGSLLDGIPDLVEGIAGAAPRLIAELITLTPRLSQAFIAELLNPAFWVGVVKALIGGIWDGLKLAWGSLGDLIGDSFAGLKAGAELIVRAAGDLWRGLGDLFKPETWKSIGEWIANALKELLGSFFGNKEKTGFFQKDGALAHAGKSVGDWFKGAGETVSGWFQKGVVGSFAIGTDYVPRDGIAQVHQGEMIVPAHGISSAALEKLNTGGGMTFNNYGVISSAQQLAQMMREARLEGVNFG